MNRNMQRKNHWHNLPKPRKNYLNIDDRYYLELSDLDNFMHLTNSDEIFNYVSRRPPYQN